MSVNDDNQGGNYFGPYACANGVPIVSADEVDENKRNLPVIFEIKKVTICMIAGNIIDEFPEIDEKKAYGFACNVWNIIS